MHFFFSSELVYFRALREVSRIESRLCVGQHLLKSKSHAAGHSRVFARVKRRSTSGCLSSVDKGKLVEPIMRLSNCAQKYTWHGRSCAHFWMSHVMIYVDTQYIHADKRYKIPNFMLWLWTKSSWHPPNKCSTCSVMYNILNFESYKRSLQFLCMALKFKCQFQWLFSSS